MGLLITIEGGDYVGKTTVAVPGLGTVLEDSGVPVLTSREPGGSPEAEKLRSTIFTKVEENASQTEIAELFNKARRIHLDQVIIPFLGARKEKTAIVILDRYLDSTRVYQGLEGKLPMEKIYELEDEFVDGYFPDITFVLYFPEEHIHKLIEIRKKLVAQTESTRSQTVWDDATIEVYKKRQQFYWKLEEIAKARGEKRVFIYIDASQSPFDIVSQLVKNTLSYITNSGDGALNHSAHSFLANLNKVKSSNFMLFQERQWKKQQALL